MYAHLCITFAFNTPVSLSLSIILYCLKEEKFKCWFLCRTNDLNSKPLRTASISTVILVLLLTAPARPAHLPPIRLLCAPVRKVMTLEKQALVIANEKGAVHRFSSDKTSIFLNLFLHVTEMSQKPNLFELMNAGVVTRCCCYLLKGFLIHSLKKKSY